jgi:uncharacterized protein YkwD
MVIPIASLAFAVLSTTANSAAAASISTQTTGIGATKSTAGAIPITPNPSSSMGWSTDSYEVELVGLTNTLRQQAGLPSLPTSPALREVARSWAIEMANAGEINHNPNLAKQVVSAWTKVGENVGFGPSIPVIHQALIQSALHYKNLVEPGWTAMAVGAARIGRRIYVVEVFELVPPPAVASTTRTVAIARARKSTVPARR